MNAPTRCLVADDHPALLAAVSAFIERHGFEVVGPAPDGPRALAVAELERPELALVDYRMPRLAGAELIGRLREVSPETAVAVYTAEADERLVADAFSAGAKAVVLKEAPLPDLVRALDSVLRGLVYIDSALAAGTIDGVQDERAALRPREVDVLRLLAEGLSHEAIGRRLSISAETVRSHLRKACGRLDASTRTQAVATALRLGLID